MGQTSAFFAFQSRNRGSCRFKTDYTAHVELTGTYRFNLVIEVLVVSSYFQAFNDVTVHCQVFSFNLVIEVLVVSSLLASFNLVIEVLVVSRCRACGRFNLVIEVLVVSRRNVRQLRCLPLVDVSIS